jgi:ABC-type lipoprotein export system ATPase subunit
LEVEVELRLEDITKEYPDPGGGPPKRVLDGIDLVVEAAETVAVVGPSGTGKSSLLNIIGGLDRPTSGRVHLSGRNLAELSDSDLAMVRNRDIGFVFQLHHLLPQCTVLENTLLPTVPMADREQRAVLRQRAIQLLERVGLGQHMDHRPGQLSGGECQRAAVVRALINKPGLVLADEPTGSLDGGTAQGLGELLLAVNHEQGAALIVVTHSHELARQMERRFALREGCLEELPS